MVDSLDRLSLAVDQLCDHELETLLVPQPLLGKISLKEMLFNAIYHVEHHHIQAGKTLVERN